MPQNTAAPAAPGTNLDELANLISMLGTLGSRAVTDASGATSKAESMQKDLSAYLNQPTKFDLTPPPQQTFSNTAIPSYLAAAATAISGNPAYQQNDAASRQAATAEQNAFRQQSNALTAQDILTRKSANIQLRAAAVDKQLEAATRLGDFGRQVELLGVQAKINKEMEQHRLDQEAQLARAQITSAEKINANTNQRYLDIANMQEAGANIRADIAAGKFKSGNAFIDAIQEPLKIVGGVMSEVRKAMAQVDDKKRPVFHSTAEVLKAYPDLKLAMDTAKLALPKEPMMNKDGKPAMDAQTYLNYRITLANTGLYSMPTPKEWENYKSLKGWDVLPTASTAQAAIRAASQSRVAKLGRGARSVAISSAVNTVAPAILGWQYLFNEPNQPLTKFPYIYPDTLTKSR